MAAYFKRSRALKVARAWWYGIKRSPPLLIAIALHALVAVILMNIVISKGRTEVVMAVDMNKILEQKFEKKIETIIEAPEIQKQPDKLPNIVVPMVPLNNISDQNRPAVPDVISTTGRGGFRLRGLGEGGLKGFVGEIRGLRRGGLDVVFVIDTTETMRGVIEEVKRKLRAIIRVLDALVGARCRIGVVCYRDRASEYDTKAFDLTTDRKKLRDFINTIEVGHGCKTEQEIAAFKAGKPIPAAEDVLNALKVATKLSWSDNAKKVIILIGDAPPHREDQQRVFSLAAAFRARGNAVVHTISSAPPIYLEGYTGMERERAKAIQEKAREQFFGIFERIAKSGGGSSISIEKDKAVVKQLLAFAFGPQWKGNIDEIYQTLGLEAQTEPKKKKG